MLLAESELNNFMLAAKDGDIGRTRDFLFDDVHWTVRYAEINTSRWLLGRKVLISPIAMSDPDLENKRIPVNLTTDDVEKAPGIETDEPVSRQYERAFHAYYGFPYYWMGQDVWGSAPYPAPLQTQHESELLAERKRFEDRIRESHLRSVREVVGYSIHALDDHIGEVSDVIIDTKTWQIRYFVVDIRRWLPGPSVLLSPQWVRNVSWQERSLIVDVEKDVIKTAPKYEHELSRDEELEVFKHYHRSPYWSSQSGNRPSHR